MMKTEVTNLIIGFTFILVGLYVIRNTYKHPDKQLMSTNLKGYLGGLGCVLIGFFLIIHKIKF